MKKYFEILELDVSASIEEVEQAYKELTEAWRPENYQNLPRFKRKAEIKLEEVNDAYERIRSYLLAKASGEDQMVFDSPTDPSSGSEQQMQPAERTEPPKVSTSSSKKILMGLVAVAAVLGTLILYLYSNRQKTLPPKPQTILAEKESAAQSSKRASPPVAADRLKKESKSNSAGKSSTEKQSPLVKTTTQKTLLQNRPDYDDLLTQEALNRYNRNPVQVKRIQNGLITIGYNPGPIDGVIGPLTTKALKQFAKDRSHIFAASDFFASDLTGGVLVFSEVSAKHPDWDRIISSEDFKRWLDNQKTMSAHQVKKLKKSATARQIIEMFDLYKTDKKTP
jgi:hypothetical protein